MLDILTHWLSDLGVTENVWLTRLLLLAAVFLVAWLAHLLTQTVLVRTAQRVAARTSAKWDDALVQHRVFQRIAQLAPAVLVYLSAGPLFPDEADASLRNVVQRLATVWIVLVVARAVAALFDAFGAMARENPATRDKPIRGYLQIAKILLWLAVAILAVAALLDKSPWALLGGLGAMTAILLLVFRDTILSFVASIQISSYDLVRVGEWIEVPNYGADGDVIDVALHAVRVQNWDKTIVTVPTVALLSGGFKNWRGMSESGGRRIKRSLSLDMASVRFLSADEVERLRGTGILSDYLDQKEAELAEWNAEADDGDFLAQRRLTNLGTFRAYLEAYLRSHPQIHDDMTFLVRQLAPGPEGLPIEVYVFSREQRWAHYEAIVADIFDHLLAVLERFDLRVFQLPTGSDVRRLYNGLSEHQATRLSNLSTLPGQSGLE